MHWQVKGLKTYALAFELMNGKWYYDGLAFSYSNVACGCHHFIVEMGATNSTHTEHSQRRLAVSY